ncbi:glycoside hydrolase family 10 protein [Candidatus Bipolaricaulota sp. J31]
MKMGTVLANKIEDLGKKLPESIEIPGTGVAVSIEDTLYLMAKWLALYGVTNAKEGKMPDEVPYLDIQKPTKLIEGEQGGKIMWQDLYALGRELSAALEANPVIPEQIKIIKNGETEAYVTADVLIYILARTLRWVDSHGSMPNYASIRPVSPPDSWPPVEKPVVKIEKVPPREGEIRGIWVWYDTLGEAGVEEAIAEIAEMGFTDVFLLVKGISGRVCWPSKIALAQYEDTTILERAVKACREHGLRIHAWFVVSKDKAYLAAYPDSRMWGIPKELGGEFRRAGSTVEFAARPDYRQYVIGLMEEVLEYGVDGIHLDYIRYPTGAWGWSPWQIGRAWMEGLDVDFLLQIAIETWGSQGDGKKFIDMYYEGRYPDINRWVQMRMDDVYAFVREIHDAVKAVKPELVLSAALMPEGGDADAYQNAFAMVHYGQRYADFGDLCDLIIPMTYHMEWGKEAGWIVQVYEGTRPVIPEEKPVLMGVQAFDISSVEFQKAIYAARQAGANGFCIFRYGTLAGSEELKAALAEALRP